MHAHTIEEIEHATAVTWGGRSVAAFRLAKDAPDGDERRRWLMDAENYRQEAIEHAAMTQDFDFLRQVMEAIEVDRSRALAIVRTG